MKQASICIELTYSWRDALVLAVEAKGARDTTTQSHSHRRVRLSAGCDARGRVLLNREDWPASLSSLPALEVEGVCRLACAVIAAAAHRVPASMPACLLLLLSPFLPLSDSRAADSAAAAVVVVAVAAATSMMAVHRIKGKARSADDVFIIHDCSSSSGGSIE